MTLELLPAPCTDIYCCTRPPWHRYVGRMGSSVQPPPHPIPPPPHVGTRHGADSGERLELITPPATQPLVGKHHPLVDRAVTGTAVHSKAKHNRAKHSAAWQSVKHCGDRDRGAHPPNTTAINGTNNIIIVAILRHISQTKKCDSVIGSMKYGERF